ncbi:helix-turn-helix domain-containing protein [Streptomyces sp. AF1A]|uniref:helix-turn-helix domain-containing protein n=1 Tax=Streptomyces sp. AF1A TaxID=3394350 RepID=UPI0039BC7690
MGERRGHGASALEHSHVYGWEVHRVRDSRHQQGPCGTCATEQSARACIEAALSAEARPGVHAWGLLSRVPAASRQPTSSWPGTPIARAVLGPDGTVAWQPPGGRGLVPAEGQDAGPTQSRGEPLSSALSRFADAARRHRTAAALSRREMAERLGCSEADVERLEGAAQVPSRGFAVEADRILGADGALAALWPSLVESAYPEWFWQVIELEQQASFVQEFETVAIPGLLQTEAYARAVFCTAHPMAPPLQIEQFVIARLDRQRILARDDPPQIMIALDEAVLRRRVGGSRTMSEQLGHLLGVAELPRVHLQVIPFSVRQHPGGMTPFRIMGFREGPEFLYGESFIGGQVTNDAQQLRQHHLAFNLIQAHALSPPDSRVLIRRLRREIEGGPD